MNDDHVNQASTTDPVSTPQAATAPQESWKSERLRTERRERLRRLRTRDGGKRLMRHRSPWVRVIVAVVAILLVFCLAAWLLFRFGWLERTLTAFRVGDTRFSVMEANMVSAFTADHFKQRQQPGFVEMPDLLFEAQSQALLDRPSQVDPNLSNRAFLIQACAAELRTTAALERESQRVGFTLGEKETKAIDDALSSLDERLTAYSKQLNMSLDEYIAGTFGPGATRDDLHAFLRRTMTAHQIMTHHYDAVKVDDDALDRYYSGHKDDLDVVSCEIAGFPISLPNDADVEARKKATDKALDEANAVKAAIDKGASFYDAAKAQLKDTIDNEVDDKHAFELHSIRKNTGRFVPEVEAWLFDAARKPGEVGVVTTMNGVYVIRFDSRAKDESHAYSVRHILIPFTDPNAAPTPQPSETTATSEAPDETNHDRETTASDQAKTTATEPGATTTPTTSSEDAKAKAEAAKAQAKKEAAANEAKAKAKAEEVLKAFLATDRSEESFAKLAKTNSADGNAATGGLYSDVQTGDMVKEFEDWATDPARKPGDTGLVKTRYGYHVMYFVGRNEEPMWKRLATDGVRSDDTKAWRDRLVNADSLKPAFGARLVATSSVFSLLVGNGYHEIVTTQGTSGGAALETAASFETTVASDKTTGTTSETTS